VLVFISKWKWNWDKISRQKGLTV